MKSALKLGSLCRCKNLNNKPNLLLMIENLKNGEREDPGCLIIVGLRILGALGNVIKPFTCMSDVTI